MFQSWRKAFVLILLAVLLFDEGVVAQNEG